MNIANLKDYFYKLLKKVVPHELLKTHVDKILPNIESSKK